MIAASPAWRLPVARFALCLMLFLASLMRAVLGAGGPERRRYSGTPEHARNEMLAVARSSLSGTGPITVEFSQSFYHREAIVLEQLSSPHIPPRRLARYARQHNGPHRR